MVEGIKDQRKRDGGKQANIQEATMNIEIDDQIVPVTA